jgi:hypothetical protein
MRLKRYLKEEYMGLYKYAGAKARIYENPTPEEIRKMPDVYTRSQQFPEATIKFIAFSPNKKMFIWASEDEGIHSCVLEYLQSIDKIPADEWGRFPESLFSGFASPDGDKMKFEWGLGYNMRDFEHIQTDGWEWVEKYFSNMDRVMAYIGNTGELMRTHHKWGEKG